MGPFLDETDGKTAETGLTISQADVRLSKGGGNFAQKNESTSASHDEIGYYIVLLDATDTATVGELLVAVHESGALPVFKTFQVVEEAIYDAIYGGSADLITKVDAIDTVVDAILVDTATTIPATIATIDTVVDAILVDTGTTLDGKIDTIDGIVDAILVDTGTTIPATIATVDTVVDAILVDTGTTLPATLDTIDNFLDTEIAAILADTNELQGDWANGGRLDLLVDSIISKVDVVDGIVDDILVDTGTTIPATIATIDTVVDAILVDTAVIGAAGAGLSGVPWNAAWDAEVQSEVADALAAYDPPTKAEMDAMWTTAATESYASDGAAATPAQLLYMILCSVSEFAVSSTTITGKKLDGSTTAMTWTLDDASSPTSRTRAS
jgi:hypothetical protein